MRGREKQRQISHEGIQRLAGGAPSRFDGKFGGVHGVPELGEPGGAEAGGRLLFGLLIGLEEEWQRQGASAKEIALTAFDWDYVLKAPLAGNCEAITGLTPWVFE